MKTISYNGYEATLDLDLGAGVISGIVTNADTELHFQGQTISEAFDAFIDTINSYCARNVGTRSELNTLPIDAYEKAAIEAGEAVLLQYDGFQATVRREMASGKIVGEISGEYGSTPIHGHDLESVRSDFEEKADFLYELLIDKNLPVPFLSEERTKLKALAITLRKFEAKFRDESYTPQDYLDYREALASNEQSHFTESVSTVFVWSSANGPRTIQIGFHLKAALAKHDLSAEALVSVFDGDVSSVDEYCKGILRALETRKSISASKPHAVANKEAISDSLIDFLIYVMVESSLENEFVLPNSFAVLLNMHLRVSSGQIMKAIFANQNHSAVLLVSANYPDQRPSQTARQLGIDKATVSRIQGTEKYKNLFDLLRDGGLKKDRKPQ
jgi:hypothetical protein